MARTLNPAALALLGRIEAGEKIPVVQLVEVRLQPETLYLSTAGVPLQWAGHTWQAIGLALAPVEDEVGEIRAVTFSLPAVSEDQLALVLQEDIEGRTVVIYDALVDPDTGTVAMAVQAWAGALDVPSITDGPVAVMAVQAEHRGTLALRPRPSRYTNDEQQRRYPGDTCLQFDPATDAAPMVWPAASFFQQ